MTSPIYIHVKRSVKEKLPEKANKYFVYKKYDGHYYEVKSTAYFSKIFKLFTRLSKNTTHWLEEVTLEEYLKELGLTVKK